MVKSNVMRRKSIIIGLVSSSILLSLALLATTNGPGTVYAQSQPRQPAEQLFCNEDPLGAGFDLHIFIEDSDLASKADPDGVTRKQITSLFIDAAYLDGRLREVNNYVRVWTYDGTPSLETAPIDLHNQNRTIDDSLFLYKQHQMIDAIIFENEGIVANHIETLFEDGIRTALETPSERPTLVIVLNEMTPNGQGEAEFASAARKIWDDTSVERTPRSAIYIIDFAKYEDGIRQDSEIVEGWKETFFATGTDSNSPQINGEFRSINSSNAFYEVGRIVQEFAAITNNSAETSAPFPTFNLLTSSDRRLPVCLFSTVRYGVLLQDPIETDRSGNLTPSAADPVKGRYVLYGEVPSANGFLELTPNGRPLSQDLDALYIYRAVSGIEQIICPPSVIFADETPFLSMEPPPSDNLTLRWGPVENTELVSLSGISRIDLEIVPVGSEPIEYEAILERQSGDDFYCGRTMVVPRPAMRILLNPELGAGHPLTLTVAISPTDMLPDAPTVTLTRLSGFHTESAPSGAAMEMNLRNISPIQEGKTLSYEYYSDDDLSAGLWLVQAHIDTRNDHDLPVRLSEEAALHIPYGDDPYTKIVISSTVRSTEPGEGINSSNKLLPFEWKSADGRVQFSVTAISSLPYDANITTEILSPPCISPHRWVLQVMIVFASIIAAFIVAGRNKWLERAEGLERLQNLWDKILTHSCQPRPTARLAADDVSEARERIIIFSSGLFFIITFIGAISALDICEWHVPLTAGISFVDFVLVGTLVIGFFRKKLGVLEILVFNLGAYFVILLQRFLADYEPINHALPIEFKVVYMVVAWSLFIITSIIMYRQLGKFK